MGPARRPLARCGQRGRVWKVPRLWRTAGNAPENRAGSPKPGLTRVDAVAGGRPCEGGQRQRRLLPAGPHPHKSVVLRARQRAHCGGGAGAGARWAGVAAGKRAGTASCVTSTKQRRRGNQAARTGAVAVQAEVPGALGLRRLRSPATQLAPATPRHSTVEGIFTHSPLVSNRQPATEITRAGGERAKVSRAGATGGGWRRKPQAARSRRWKRPFEPGAPACLPTTRACAPLPHLPAPRASPW